MLGVIFTDSTSLSGTHDSVTSLTTLFFLKPAARTLQAWSLNSTSTSTFTAWAQEAASSSCAHSSSLSLHCRYKPQHRGTEVLHYKNNKHCTTGMASGEVPDGHKIVTWAIGGIPSQLLHFTCTQTAQCCLLQHVYMHTLQHGDLSTPELRPIDH